jgi:DNA-binding beta-propeller fold protein YncE
VAWASSPLLTTTGFPPFGANGLEFNRDESALFVANTGNDTIVRIPVAAGAPGTAEVFTNAVNGADGLILDRQDNLWVCANQADEIVVIDSSGKAIAKLGDFEGVRRGSPVGLLFPASLARHGDWIYVTNLSLDLRPITGQQSVDSQWTAEVTRHTIARLRARIPHVKD